MDCWEIPSVLCSYDFSFFNIHTVNIHIVIPYSMCLFHLIYPSLNIMPSRYILIVANGRISFSWLSNIPLCVGTISSLSINPLMGSCFHILAIVNNVTVNREVQTSFPYAVFISLDTHPEVVLLDHMVMLFLLF